MSDLIIPRNRNSLASARLELSRSQPGDTSQWFAVEPKWFKRATFYEVYIRGFADGNDDGIGDFRGLTEHLDYSAVARRRLRLVAADVRIAASRRRLRHLRLLRLAPRLRHDRATSAPSSRAPTSDGIRVIADLVLNHTSSDHQWFQESRSSRDSPKRDWYVWSDTDERYNDARVIFVDTETSNWTWDPVAGQYYWHRFFSHQPDLNYDNPEVRDEMLAIMTYWFDYGLDGFRLDAVPYLFEREGTNCENLPETHAYLRRVRREIEQLYPDRVLLAEANQWPSDVVSTSVKAMSATWHSTSR